MRLQRPNEGFCDRSRANSSFEWLPTVDFDPLRISYAGLHGPRLNSVATDQAPSLMPVVRLHQGRYEDFHRHPLKCVAHSNETACHRDRLPYVTHDGNWDQIEAADTPVRRIEGDPARAGHIDFGPGMGRSRTAGPYNVMIRIVEIAGDNPRPESEAASRFAEEDGEITTRSSRL